MTVEMEELSVLSLISRLSAHYAALNTPIPRFGISQHIYSQDVKKRRVRLIKHLKRVAFERILKKKPILKSRLEYISYTDAIYGEGLKLSIRGDQESSVRLIQLTDTLDKSDPELDNVLRFILALAGSKPEPKEIFDFCQIGDCSTLGPGDIRSGIVKSYSFRGQFFGKADQNIALRNKILLGNYHFFICFKSG